MNQERIYSVILGPHVTEKSASSGGETSQVADPYTHLTLPTTPYV